MQGMMAAPPSSYRLSHRVCTHRVAKAAFWRTFHHYGKKAQPGEGGGARPPFFTISTITYKVVVYVPAEKADTFPIPIFLLYSVACPVRGGGGKMAVLEFLNNLLVARNRVGIGLSY
jgi:hypothetical protein